MVRLAQAHYQKIHTFYSITLPNVQIWNRDFDRSVKPDVLKEISRRTLIPFERLESLTLSNYEGYLFEKHTSLTNMTWLMPLGIYHRIRKQYGVQFCAGCFIKDKDEPYFRRKWRLSLSVVCPDCNLKLYDHCPKCCFPITYFRMELGHKTEVTTLPLSTCVFCKFNLKKSKLIGASKSAVSFQKDLYSLLDNGCSENFQYSHLYFEGFRHILKLLSSAQKKTDILRSIICKNLEIPKPKILGGYKNNFERIPLVQRLVLIEMATWLLKDWPNRFINLCLENGVYSSYLLKDKKNLPYWFYAPIKQNLHLIYTPWREVYPLKAFNKSYDDFVKISSKIG